MNPVDTPRDRTCVRCHGTFTERAGAITRICGRCRGRDAGATATVDTPGTIVDRRRERTCVRCDATFVERAGDVSCLCPPCDSGQSEV